MKFITELLYFFKSIKLRLTAWYLLVIVVLLAIFSTVAYLMLENNLRRDLDESLQNRVSDLLRNVKLEDSELILIYDSNGNLVQGLGPSVEYEQIEGIVQQALLGTSSFITTSTTEGREVRLYVAPFVTDSTTRFAIVIGRLPVDTDSLLRTFRIVLEYASLAVIVLAGIGGMFLANRWLKPVDWITGTAREIGEGNLGRRINIRRGDEMGRLATTINGMVERLEKALNRQRQFTADASHELRTPLAVIQAESSLALDKERTQEEYRKSLELVTQEVKYMTTVINKLLLLARIDAGEEPISFQEVNMKDLLTELAADLEILTRDKGLQLNLGEMENLSVNGDRVKLRQLFLNILENAIRYTPSGGTISGSLLRKNNTAVATIADTGIGISPEHLPFIFERFYRVDKARSRAEGGAGLGLAIARNIAKVHGGEIEVESEVSKGSAFHIILPLLSPAAGQLSFSDLEHKRR